jgi:archaellum component FlaC
MKRWNLRKIILFSHDDRRRDVNLDLESVNIITGESHTGKSALIEIINYAMGSSECYIPSFVRDASSWVGLLWVRNEMQFLICRKTPSGTRKMDNSAFFDVGKDLEIPAGQSELFRKSDIDVALKQFERLLGIPEVEIEPYSPTRPKEPITVRHVMPYLLQDDSTIIDKAKLLWSSDDQDEKRVAIINRLPFFLGVDDPASIELEGELRRLRRELAIQERRADEAQQIAGQEINRAQTLLAEAQAVGLLDASQSGSKLQEILDLLKLASNWQAIESSNRNQGQNNNLVALYNSKFELETQISELKNQLTLVEQLGGLREHFGENATLQRDRLAVIEIIPTQSKITTCPTCAQPLENVSESVQSVRKIYERVRQELNNVERQKPLVARASDQIREQLSAVRSELERAKQQIRAVVQEDELGRQLLDLDQRRYKVIGRISLYLDTLTQIKDATAQSTNIDNIKLRVIELENLLSSQTKTDLLQEKRLLISSIATEIFQQLPFDPSYRSGTVDMNPKDLSVGVITSKRRESMRNIGSDENYLTLHLSVMLAFHRLFADLESPIPGLLVLDQLSRPYFPEDTEEVEVISQDRMSLKQYFDLLFKEATREESLQILVLEHAYFTDDETFKSATKERWIDGRPFLVPADWPDGAAA